MGVPRSAASPSGAPVLPNMIDDQFTTTPAIIGA
jgi:hypothetical protein